MILDDYNQDQPVIKEVYRNNGFYIIQKTRSKILGRTNYYVFKESNSIIYFNSDSLKDSILELNKLRMVTV